MIKSLLLSVLLVVLSGCSASYKEGIYKECVKLVYTIEFETSAEKFKYRCDYDPFYENCPCGIAMEDILKETNGQSK